MSFKLQSEIDDICSRGATVLCYKMWKLGIWLVY